MTSKLSILVIGNFALVTTLVFGRVTKYLFLGTLREVEVIARRRARGTHACYTS